ncbi:MAG: phospholipase D-like domain-containing protein [Bdellovibrionota bacterium]
MKNLSRVLFLSLAAAFAVISQAKADFAVEVAEAPGSNLALTVEAIQSARQSIFLNIYELTSPEVADALIRQIGAGVQVQILEEGQPVGGMSAAAKGIESQIVQAMQQARGNDHFFVMTSKGTAGKRRFHFDHAKYAVIDDVNLLIGSENYSPTGNPSPGTKGNRGWEVFIHDAGIAGLYKQTFLADAVVNRGDVTEATGGSLDLNLEAGRRPRRGQNNNPWWWPYPSPAPAPAPAPAPPPKPIPTPAPAPAPKPNPGPGGALVASAVQQITSPDTSLRGLVSLIDGASRSIDIQQMTFDSAWSSGTNPLIDAITRAAGRGVRVRVLLNDETVFNHSGNPSKSKNLPTISALNQIPNVMARTANLKAMGVDYIHNKGMLVDGNITLISSINWDENAIQRNREAAVAITSPGVFAHYEAIFANDWQVSAQPSDVAVSVRVPDDSISVGPVVSVACPNSVDLKVIVGKLHLDADDESFASLENSTVSGTFEKVRSREGCVLGSRNFGIESSSRRYLEIRGAAGGFYNVTLEGYTPRGNKLYSVRAKVERSSHLDGSFEGAVYNGSAGHEFLGTATMDINPNN